MKVKILIIALLLVPFVSQAASIPKSNEVIRGEVYDYVLYYMYDNETIASVAKKFGVPESNVITDYEGSTGGDWRQIMVVVSGTLPTTQTTTSETEKSLPVKTKVDTLSKAEVLEKENEQLKNHIALLQQIILLLKTLAGLKQ